MEMKLFIKWLIFLDCDITQDVAEVFVEALKGDHTFHEIQLIETMPYYSSSRWIDRNDDDYDGQRRKRISGEIELLTWSNQF